MYRYEKRAQSKSTANLAKSNTKRPTILKREGGANTTKNMFINKGVVVAGLDFDKNHIV